MTDWIYLVILDSYRIGVFLPGVKTALYPFAIQLASWLKTGWVNRPVIQLNWSGKRVEIGKLNTEPGEPTQWYTEVRKRRGDPCL